MTTPIGSAAGPRPQAARRSRHHLGTAFRRNLAASSMAYILRAAAAFGSSVLVARALGPSARGEYGFVLTTLGVLLMLGGSGSFAAVSRLSAHHQPSKAELADAAGILGLVIGLALGAGFTVIYLGLHDSLFRGVSWFGASFVLACIPVLLVGNYWTATSALSYGVPWTALASTAGGVGFLIAVVAAYATGTLQTHRALVLWGATSLIPLVLLGRGTGSGKAGEALSMALRLGRYALVANGVELAGLLVLRVDVFAVKADRGYKELGVYMVAVGLAEALLQLGQAVRLSILPQQGDLADRDHLRDLIGRAARWLLGLGALATVGSALVGRPVIRALFGAGFSGAAPALTILIPGVVAMALQDPIRDYLMVEGRIRQVSVAGLAALTLNITLNVILLQRHTFVAAALTSTISYVLIAAACLYAFGSTIERDPRPATRLDRRPLSVFRSRGGR